jgi:hypothetical protein
MYLFAYIYEDLYIWRETCIYRLYIYIYRWITEWIQYHWICAMYGVSYGFFPPGTGWRGDLCRSSYGNIFIDIQIETLYIDIYECIHVCLYGVSYRSSSLEPCIYIYIYIFVFLHIGGTFGMSIIIPCFSIIFMNYWQIDRDTDWYVCVYISV